MANKTPEIRLTQGTAVLLVLLVIGALYGLSQGWTLPGKKAPVVEKENPALSVVPAIEKTKIYISAFDNADYVGESQKNRVTGTADIIKSGNLLETINTSSSSGVASTAEFNGGDVVTVLADASNYYANSVEAEVIETLQPFEVMIQAAATPDVYVEDDKGNTATSITLDLNDVSKVHSIIIERPGDDNAYNLCGIAADYDDDQIEVRVKQGDSFVKGENNLDEEYDALDSDGADFVWKFDKTIKDFDSYEIQFVVGSAKNVNPGAQNLTFTVFDCEKNLQDGKIVYTSESSSDSDVGLANINEVVSIA